MATTITFIHQLEEAIKNAVKQRIVEIAETIAKEAAEKLKKQVESEIDIMALTVLRNYSFIDNMTHLEIRVKKDI